MGLLFNNKNMSRNIDYNRDFHCFALVMAGIGTEGTSPNCVNPPGRSDGIWINGSPASLQLFVSQSVATATFALSTGAQMVGSSMNLNQLRALNATRCALTSLGDNTWTFLASAMWALKFVDIYYALMFILYLNAFYPYICTCNEDANIFAYYFGGNSKTASVMSACTEAAQKATMA